MRLARLDRRFALELSLNAGHGAASKGTIALPAIKVPLLVIQATYVRADRMRVPLAPDKVTAWADSVRALLPDAKHSVMSNAGHFVMIEAARKTNAMVRKFVGGLEEGHAPARQAGEQYGDRLLLRVHRHVAGDDPFRNLLRGEVCEREVESLETRRGTLQATTDALRF